MLSCNTVTHQSSLYSNSLLLSVPPVPSNDTMKTVKVKRVNRFDESIDMYTEFFRPYELTFFDDTFCIGMTSSAK